MAYNQTPDIALSVIKTHVVSDYKGFTDEIIIAKANNNKSFVLGKTSRVNVYQRLKCGLSGNRVIRSVTTSCNP